MANASSIQDSKGAITLWPALLRVERTIGGTAQRPIRLRDKSGPWKATREREARPLRRTILRRRRMFLRRRRFNGRSRLDDTGFGKFRRAQLGRGELLPQFQAQVPHPLIEDLPEFLPIGGMGTPSVGILLPIFIGQDCLKRSSMQVEVKHIRGGKRRRGKGADKQFIDHAITLDADFGRRGSDGMSGHHQTYTGSGWRQRNGWAIVKSAGHPTFRMDAHLIRCMGKHLCDDLQIQEGVVTAARNHPKTSGENIDEWSRVAIKSIQTKQYRRDGKREFGCVIGDHRDGPQQFSSVIPIAWPTKRAQKLVCMRLEQDRAGAHDFSPFTPQVARSANLVEATMGGGQRLHLRERTLTGGLSRPIHIHDHPLLTRPVEQATGRSKWFPSEQIFLKERAECLHTCLVKGCKKAGKRRAMGQVMTPKEGHKRVGKRDEPFIKGQQGGFARNCIADEHHDKIDEVIVTKARAGKPDSLLDGFEQTQMSENLSEGGHFSQPGRG